MREAFKFLPAFSNSLRQITHTDQENRQTDDTGIGKPVEKKSTQDNGQSDTQHSADQKFHPRSHSLISYPRATRHYFHPVTVASLASPGP